MNKRAVLCIFSTALQKSYHGLLIKRRKALPRQENINTFYVFVGFVAILQKLPLNCAHIVNAVLVHRDDISCMNCLCYPIWDAILGHRVVGRYVGLQQYSNKYAFL
jgi:hypothetical protein